MATCTPPRLCKCSLSWGIWTEMGFVCSSCRPRFLLLPAALKPIQFITRLVSAWIKVMKMSVTVPRVWLQGSIMLCAAANCFQSNKSYSGLTVHYWAPQCTEVLKSLTEQCWFSTCSFFFPPKEIILMAAQHSGGYLEFILPTKLIHHASALLLWAVLCLGVFIRF